MATTVVYPALDVSGTGSISTIISTAGTFAGSLTASSLTVTGTATFSGTAVFVGTAQFLATATFSATVRFLSAVQVSATCSVGTFKIDGKQAGYALLGSMSLVAQNSVRFSGSWSDYALFDLYVITKVTAAATSSSLAVYVDGGTTPILSLPTTTASAGTFTAWTIQIGNSAGFKSIDMIRKSIANNFATDLTATANTGFLNCIQFAVGASVTLSSGFAMLWGRRGRT